MPLRLIEQHTRNALHGGCPVCGRKTRSPIVTTEIEVEGEGVLELCLECVFEAAALGGGLSPEVAQQKDLELRKYRLEREEVEHLRGLYEDLIASVDDAATRFRADL